MRSQIVNAFNAGPSIVQYAGHGSVEVWTGAGLLQTNDAAQLSNGHRLPLVVHNLKHLVEVSHRQQVPQALMRPQ